MVDMNLKDVRSCHLLPRLRSRKSICSQRAELGRTPENGSQSPTKESKVSKTRRKRSWGSRSHSCARQWTALRPGRIQPKVPEAELLRCNGPVSFITDSDLRIRHQNSSYSKTHLLGKYLAGNKTMGQDAKLEHEA